MEGTLCDQNQKQPHLIVVVAIPLIILHSITAVSAIVLNGLVLWTVRKTPSLHTPSRILLCSLAMTDFLTGVLVQGLAMVYFLSTLKDWPGIFCLCWLFITRIGYVLGSTSLLTLTAISVDRCLAIVIKISYRSVVTKKRTACLVSGIWGLACTAVPPSVHLLSPNQYLFLALVFISLCIIVIISSYSIAFYSLKRLSVQVSNPGHVLHSHHPASYFNVFKYKRYLVTMIISLTATLVLYTPLLALSPTKGIASPSILVPMLVSCEFFVALNASVNPVINLWRMRDLRQAVRHLLRRD